MIQVQPAQLEKENLEMHVAHLREGELVEGGADALLAALHGGRALRCVQGHRLVGFNYHTILKKAQFYPGETVLQKQNGSYRVNVQL